MPFFIKIRKNEIKTDSLKRYVLYGIGEILLVVIGILIALNINDWDQNRADRKQEALSLSNLQNDLGEQSELLNQYIKAESDYYENGTDVLKHFAFYRGFSKMDSVLPKLNSLASRKTFNPINTTFRELISTGTIRLIQCDTLKQSILRYYHNLERVNLIVSNNNARLVDGLFNPVFFEQTVFLVDVGDTDVEKINQGIFDSESVKSLYSASAKILSDPQKALHLFNVLEERVNVASGHKTLYLRLQKETHALHKTINSELKTRSF